YLLHTDDFLALMLGDGVPDGHVVGRQVQFVGTGQRVVAGERVGQVGTGSSSRWKIVRWTVQRRAAAGPRCPARTSRGSGRDDHSPILHASASCSRVNAGVSSPGPGSAWIWAMATPRPTSRGSRFSSAFIASSSARGMLTSSDASVLTRGSLSSALQPQV